MTSNSESRPFLISEAGVIGRTCCWTRPSLTESQWEEGFRVAVKEWAGLVGGETGAIDATAQSGVGVSAAARVELATFCRGPGDL